MIDTEIQAIKNNVAEKAYKKGYSQGIEKGRAEQKKIDIEKAINWLNMHTDWDNSPTPEKVVEAFRKALEE